MPISILSKRPYWIAAFAVALIAVALATAQGRRVVENWLGALRVQKVQAVNLDLAPFVDTNANPALHQMVSQMISDKVNVTLNELNQSTSARWEYV